MPMKLEHRRWLERAAAAEDIAEYDLAVELLTQLATALPSSPLAFLRRGLIYIKTKKFLKAVVDLSEAIRLDPRCKEAYYNRGVAYGELERFDREMADYTSALELDPEMADALDSRGDAHYRARQYDRAMDDYRQAIIIYTEKRDYEKAWKLIYKVEHLGWKVDRDITRNLLRASGRRY